MDAPTAGVKVFGDVVAGVNVLLALWAIIKSFADAFGGVAKGEVAPTGWQPFVALWAWLRVLKALRPGNDDSKPKDF